MRQKDHSRAALACGLVRKAPDVVHATIARRARHDPGMVTPLQCPVLELPAGRTALVDMSWVKFTACIPSF